MPSIVQDFSAGIWVNLEVVKPNVPISTGDLVEIDGVTEAPDFAPQVGGPVFKVTGRAPLPPARRVSFAEMSSTQEDSQRAEVEGIVHTVFKRGSLLYLEVTSADGHVTGRLPSYKRQTALPLVDARVRIRGTSSSQFNSANQMTGCFHQHSVRIGNRNSSATATRPVQHLDAGNFRSSQI